MGLSSLVAVALNSPTRPRLRFEFFGVSDTSFLVSVTDGLRPLRPGLRCSAGMPVDRTFRFLGDSALARSFSRNCWTFAVGLRMRPRAVVTTPIAISILVTSWLCSATTSAMFPAKIVIVDNSFTSACSTSFISGAFSLRSFEKDSSLASACSVTRSSKEVCNIFRRVLWVVGRFASLLSKVEPWLDSDVSLSITTTSHMPDFNAPITEVFSLYMKGLSALVCFSESTSVEIMSSVASSEDSNCCSSTSITAVLHICCSFGAFEFSKKSALSILVVFSKTLSPRTFPGNSTIESTLSALSEIEISALDKEFAKKSSSESIACSSLIESVVLSSKWMPLISPLESSEAEEHSRLLANPTILVPAKGSLPEDFPVFAADCCFSMSFTLTTKLIKKEFDIDNLLVLMRGLSNNSFMIVQEARRFLCVLEVNPAEFLRDKDARMTPRLEVNAVNCVLSAFSLTCKDKGLKILASATDDAGKLCISDVLEVFSAAKMVSIFFGFSLAVADILGDDTPGVASTMLELSVELTVITEVTESSVAAATGFIRVAFLDVDGVQKPIKSLTLFGVPQPLLDLYKLVNDFSMHTPVWRGEYEVIKTSDCRHIANRRLFSCVLLFTLFSVHIIKSILGFSSATIGDI
uniref:Uncharacterized protein n=1 Tax=Glossina palpalis gambiensis TaxID=67801 RepID=A0A1B0C386_9MUSC